MRKPLTLISLIAITLAGLGQTITLRPSFQTGQTLRYRTSADVRMRNENDSMHCLTIMLPQIYIENINEKGGVIVTSNSLEKRIFQQINIFTFIIWTYLTCQFKQEMSSIDKTHPFFAYNGNYS